MAYRMSRAEAVTLAWMAVGVGWMTVWQVPASDWLIPLAATMGAAALGVGFCHHEKWDALVWASLPGWVVMGWAIGPPRGVRVVLMPATISILLSVGALVRSPRIAIFRTCASAAVVALLGIGSVLGAGAPWILLGLLGVPRWIQSERARLRAEHLPQDPGLVRRLWVEWMVVTLGGLLVGYWIHVIAR